MKLQIWRHRNVLLLDNDPSGQEEEQFLFSNTVNHPTDLNSVILQERMQDMGERIIFADRAFLITFIWVIFLILLPLIQMIFSCWGKGLSDSQFITVVTTTTASVFGFWALVGRYLFPDKNKAPNKPMQKRGTN